MLFKKKVKHFNLMLEIPFVPRERVGSETQPRFCFITLYHNLLKFQSYLKLLIKKNIFYFCLILYILKKIFFSN
jgi:hypothetical protein